MAFQFNFFTENAVENGTDTPFGNGKLQQESASSSLIFSDNQKAKNKEVSTEGTILNRESLLEIPNHVAGHSSLSKSENAASANKHCFAKSAKEHDVPKEVSKVLENKVMGTLPSTCHVDISVVEAVLKEESFGEDIVSKSISSHSDLITGVYEGGLKVWECTFDLMDYLSEAEIHLAHKSVLDLGCGAGLLGIVALKGNAERVHFQDYNSTVIEEITLPNVVVNCARQDDDGIGGSSEPSLKRFRKGELSEDFLSKCKFFSGEWSAFCEFLLNSKQPVAKYDLILTSETIYNPDYYEALHDVLSRLLKTNGCIYLASKAHYFGCGGGALLFTKFVEEKNVFKSRIVKVIDRGLKRFILELVFKCSC